MFSNVYIIPPFKVMKLLESCTCHVCTIKTKKYHRFDLVQVQDNLWLSFSLDIVSVYQVLFLSLDILCPAVDRVPFAPNSSAIVLHKCGKRLPLYCY